MVRQSKINKRAKAKRKLPEVTRRRKADESLDKGRKRDEEEKKKGKTKNEK